MVMTVLSMCGLGMITPNSVNAAASAGDLIKMEGNSSVYYFDGAKRFVFPNEATYFSWYSDFSGVVTIPASELQSYQLGGNVTMRPGTKLVKITTDPKVYAVEANGVLRHVQTEAQAIALYGTDWAKRVVDVPDAFFTNYSIGTALASGNVPAGSLVKNAGSSNVYYFDGTNYRAIGSEAAMTANRFSFDNVLTISNTITAGGNAITAMETALVKTSQGGTTTGPVITGSGLMVSLNAATPVSMNVPQNAPVEFLKINLTAANDGPVNVSSITLTAHGLSDATNIDEVTFYDNGVKVGTSKNVNSDRVATFNFATPIYVAAGTTKTLAVNAKVAITSGSYGLGIASASDIVSSGASVSGSFPINGNLMSGVTSTIGSMTVTPASASSVSTSFGEDDILLADFSLVAGNNEDALVQTIRLYNGGTNSNDIVSNLRLFIDGEEIATGSYFDRYVTFTLNNYAIEKGQTASAEVRGDIGTGSATDTIKLYLKEANDLVAIGKTHGFNLPTTTTYSSTVLITANLSAGDFTVDMDKAAVPSQDIKADTNDVVLAHLKMTSNGENAVLSAIAGASFYVTHSSSSAVTALIENAELVDLSTGGIYDLTVATSSLKNELTLDEEIYFTKGQTKTFALRADVVAGVAENVTFQATLAGGMTIEGETSGVAITSITPSSVSGAIMTVKAASLTLTPMTLNNVTVVGGSNDVVVYQAKVKAGSADDIRIQSVKLTAATTTAATASAFGDSNITKLELYLNGKLLKSLSNQISGDNVQNATITFNSLNSAYYTVAAGAEVDLIVKASFASTVTTGEFLMSIDADGDITARSVDGAKSVTPSTVATDSRMVKVAAVGTLTAKLVTTDVKANRDSFLLAGSETEAGRYLGELQFTTTNEAIKVKTLTLTETGSSTNADLSSVKLVKADGTVVATKTVDADGSVTFDPFDVVFDADQTTSLFIVAVAKGINVNGDPVSTARSGAVVNYSLGAITAMGNNSGTTLGSVTTTGTGSSTSAIIVGSKLNSIVSNMSNTTLTGGNQILGKYKFNFNNGINRDSANQDLKAILTSLTVAFSKSTGVDVASNTIKLYVEGTANEVLATSTANMLAADTAGTATWDSVALASLVDSAKMDGEVTLVISGTVTGTTATGEYVQTSLSDVSGSGSVVTYSSNGVNHTEMWLPVTSVSGAILSE